MLPFHLLVLVLSLRSIEGALAAVAPYYLEPGFHFELTQELSVPVSKQCEQVRLKWTRDASDTGPPPVAPYFLQVYYSASPAPFTIEAGSGPTFNWTVPFAADKQYQICMFDINGVSGGCMQTYSIISGSQTTCQFPPTSAQLSVTATVPTGELSKVGYVDQCNVLSVAPSTGLPPYTLTIAPSGHPPYNISSNSMNAISWPVALPVGSQFFASLLSSDKQVWSSGLIRVGGQGPVTCLAPGTILKSEFNTIVIGGTVGGFLFGLLLGLFSYFLYLRMRPRRKSPSQKYFTHPYHARDDPTKPLRTGTPAASVIGTTVAPSTIAPSLFKTPLSIRTQTPRLVDLPTPPLEPLRPARAPHSRNHSLERTAFSDTGSGHHGFPPDLKRPLPPEVPLFSNDNASEVTSSTGGGMPGPSQLVRTTTQRSKAPTYVPRTPPPPRRGRQSRPAGGLSSDLEDSTELPPVYGRHMTDHTLTHDPDILSSGMRF